MNDTHEVCSANAVKQPTNELVPYENCSHMFNLQPFLSYPIILRNISLQPLPNPRPPRSPPLKEYSNLKTNKEMPPTTFNPNATPIFTLLTPNKLLFKPAQPLSKKNPPSSTSPPLLSLLSTTAYLRGLFKEIAFRLSPFQDLPLRSALPGQPAHPLIPFAAAAARFLSPAAPFRLSKILIGLFEGPVLVESCALCPAQLSSSTIKDLCRSLQKTPAPARVDSIRLKMILLPNNADSSARKATPMDFLSSTHTPSPATPLLSATDRPWPALPCITAFPGFRLCGQSSQPSQPSGSNPENNIFKRPEKLPNGQAFPANQNSQTFSNTQTSTPQIKCACRSTLPFQPLIACSACPSALHIHCLGFLSPTDPRLPSPFLCPACSKLTKANKKTQASKNHAETLSSSEDTAQPPPLILSEIDRCRLRSALALLCSPPSPPVTALPSLTGFPRPALEKTLRKAFRESHCLAKTRPVFQPLKNLMAWLFRIKKTHALETPPIPVI